MTNKDRILYLSTSLLFITAVIFIAYGFLPIKKNPSNILTDKDRQAQRLQVEKEDDQILSTQDNQTGEQVAKSLERYTAQGLPNSIEYILTSLDSNDTQIRAAAIEAAGAYAWASINIFKSAINSGSSTERLAALKGMAKRPDPQRKELLKRSMNDSSFSLYERLTAYMSLARSDSGGEDKEKMFSYIIKQLDNLSEEQAIEFQLDLISYGPDSYVVIQHVRDVLLGPQVAIKPENFDAYTRLLRRANNYANAFDKDWLQACEHCKN